MFAFYSYVFNFVKYFYYFRISSIDTVIMGTGLLNNIVVVGNNVSTTTFPKFVTFPMNFVSHWHVFTEKLAFYL